MLSLLLLIPLIGIIFLSFINDKNNIIKITALTTSIINLITSLVIYILYDYSSIDYQFVEQITEINGINIYIGLDGISIYFVLLTTFITPLVILSN